MTYVGILVVMPHPFPESTTRFVFAPATYPHTPLNEAAVFLHGVVTDSKDRNGDSIVRAKDEKGEWEAYMEYTPFTKLEKGQSVRAFGIVKTQPDGKVVVAARWIKQVDEGEFHYCLRETQKEWSALTQTHANLRELTPFVPPTNTPHVSSRSHSPRRNEPDEFISANELKVEREFI